jgi:hypothetical protein
MCLFEGAEEAGEILLHRTKNIVEIVSKVYLNVSTVGMFAARLSTVIKVGGWQNSDGGREEG